MSSIQPHLTPEQYLELDRASKVRNEYFKGRMYAKSDGEYWHAHIWANFVLALENALNGRGCLIAPGDVRVRISPQGLYTYPDVAVVCDEPQYLDAQRDTLLNPKVVVEVLSPSTEGYDRGFKCTQYRTLESLQEYALVWQTKPQVEVYRRLPSGKWLLSDAIGLEAACRFESVDCRIPLSDIYSLVEFGELGAEIGHA